MNLLTSSLCLPIRKLPNSSASYEEFTTKLIGERKATTDELGKMGHEVSNLDKCVDEIINYASNLSTTWDLAG